MEENLPLKLVLIMVVALAVAILFTPIPYYGPKTDVACIMMVGAECPPRAWQLTPSLWQKITAPKKSNPLPSNAEDKFCGGIANISCPGGYTCKLDGSYPDAGGKCVK